MLNKVWFKIIIIVIIAGLLFLVPGLFFSSVQASADNKADVIIGFSDQGRPGVKKEVRSRQNNLVQSLGGDVERSFNSIDAVQARLSLQAIEELSKNEQVSYIEPNYKVEIVAQQIPWGVERIFEKDSYRFHSWNISRGEGVAIAVIDTGVDENHEDLPELLGGVNTIDSSHWGNDGHGHGTHVAGTIAALDNDHGVVGVAPEAGLYAVKALTNSGGGSVASVIDGIEWACEQDVQIINMSFGMRSYSQALEEAVEAAYESGILIVAAAGNDGDSLDNVLYPARFEQVMAVSAALSNDQITTTSSRGPDIELIAPGQDVFSTIPDNNYDYMSGTSMAAPHVAGSAALLLGADDGLSNIEVRELLQQNAEDLGLSAIEQGYGLVRPDLALIELTGSLPLEQKRLFGSNRIFTAIEISLDSYPEEKSAGAVVIARDDDFADALPGGVLAYKERGPLLITKSSELHPDVEAEIRRVLKDDGTIYILGGKTAISEAAETQLRGMGDYEVNRIAGSNRTETALEIARAVDGDSGKAIVAYSNFFSDGLAISSYAAQEGIPILTSGSGKLSGDARTYLTEKNVGQVYVVGGEGVISEAVFTELEELVGKVSRLGGGDRYETARKIAEEFYPSPTTVTLAYGRNFPDALAGGVNAALSKAPVLLVESDTLPDEIRQYLMSKKDSVKKIVLYGGHGVVSDVVFDEAASLVE